MRAAACLFLSLFTNCAYHFMVKEYDIEVENAELSRQTLRTDMVIACDASENVHEGNAVLFFRCSRTVTDVSQVRYRIRSESDRRFFDPDGRVHTGSFVVGSWREEGSGASLCWQMYIVSIMNLVSAIPTFGISLAVMVIDVLTLPLRTIDILPRRWTSERSRSETAVVQRTESFLLENAYLVCAGWRTTVSNNSAFLDLDAIALAEGHWNVRPVCRLFAADGTLISVHPIFLYRYANVVPSAGRLLWTHRRETLAALLGLIETAIRQPAVLNISEVIDITILLASSVPAGTAGAEAIQSLSASVKSNTGQNFDEYRVLEDLLRMRAMVMESLNM